MKRFLPSLDVVRSLLIVAVVAAVVGVVGTRLAEGDPPPPADTPPPPGSTPPPFDPALFPFPSPEPTRAPPTSVTIRGKEIPLAPEMTYVEFSRGGPTITYSPSGAAPRHSWLSLNDEGRIRASHILAEDLPLFQPFIGAALPQLPTTAVIAGREVTLPPGMTAGELLPAAGSATKVWCATLTPIPVKPTPSLLCVDQDWNTVRNEIHPDEGDAFQPLLEAVTSELPDRVVVNGYSVWPLPGAALQRVIEHCEAGTEATVPCGTATYTIRRSGFSFIVFREDGIVIDSVAPEDRADLKPVFDAFSTPP
jgi:hypothetical protein